MVVRFKDFVVEIPPAVILAIVALVKLTVR
jgi:hypothetical protein